MPPLLQQLLARPLEIYRQLSAGRRMAVLAVMAVALAGVAVSVVLAGRTSFSLLYGGLDPQETGKIIANLEEQGISYRTEAGGTLIKVPEQDVMKARFKLGDAGLPSAGGIGFEIFDNHQLGLTDKLFDVNEQRALQGELCRTIESSDAVRKARVHLNLPKPSIYLRNQKKAGASLVLWLKPGHDLPPHEIRTMAHIVATALGRGLQPNDVKITNSRWELLHPSDPSGESAFSVAHMRQRQDLESHLENKVKSLLVNTVGEGKAAISIVVELNRSHQERQSETVNDDNKAAIRETTSSRKMQPLAAGGGTSLADPANPDPGGQNEEFEETDTESMVGVTRELSVTMPGAISRLSLSLLLDDSLADKKDELGEIVKAAVGFDEKRRDSYVVQTLAFGETADKEPAPASSPLLEYLPLAGHLTEAVVVLFVLFTLVGLMRSGAKKTAGGAAGKADEEEEEEEPDVRVRLKQYVEDKPQEAREVLVSWLNEEMNL